MEENGFPVEPAILGVVLGKMLEENLVTSMVKSDSDPLLFFTRPIDHTRYSDSQFRNLVNDADMGQHYIVQKGAIGHSGEGRPP